jgi:hypothetical protein
MELRNVECKEDFSRLYNDLGLETTNEKIDFLQTAMGIICTRFESGTKDDDILKSLQQHALEGWPKGRLV